MLFLIECLLIYLPQNGYVSIVAKDESDVESENSALVNPSASLTGFMNVPIVFTSIPIPPPDRKKQARTIIQP